MLSQQYLLCVLAMFYISIDRTEREPIKFVFDNGCFREWIINVSDTKRIEDQELKQLVFAAPSEIHGTGLFSRRNISDREYIGTFHGPEVEEDGEHVLWVETENTASGYIGISGENLLRYLNHDSPGNAVFYGLDLYANDEIQSGAEITLDYSG